MKRFKDFGIRPTSKSLTGDKIKIDRILNKEIMVYDYRIEDSKFGNNNSKCLYMQIETDGNKRVVFSGSRVLIELIEQVPKTDFPFLTVIIKENERLEFS